MNGIGMESASFVESRSDLQTFHFCLCPTDKNEFVRIENMKKGLHVMVAAPGFTASNIRKTALNANGRQQGESPRNENKMMTAEKCAAIIVKGIRKRKREIIMTFVEGKLAVFLSKWLPGLVDRLSYSLMAKEPDSPFK